MMAQLRRADSRLLQEVMPRIRTAAEPQRIILFGSRAWGEGQADSDLDLLIIVDTALPRDKRPLPFCRPLVGLGVEGHRGLYPGGGGGLEDDQLQPGSDGPQRGEGAV